MQSRNWIPALSLAGLFALQATAPNAQEAVGKATSVKPQAEGSHAGLLASGSNVYSKETVRTGDAGQADLKFQTATTSLLDQNRASGSISSCTTRINQRVQLRSRRQRAVSICNGITGHGGSPGQDPLWHARRARVIRTDLR